MPPPPDPDPLDIGDDGVDIAQLGQTAAWGGLAALALFVAVLAARSDVGSQRIAAAMNELRGLPATAASVSRAETDKGDADTRALAAQVQALSLDRDRLMARLEMLERSTEVTGSARMPAAPIPTPVGSNERVIPGVLPGPGTARAAGSAANGSRPAGSENPQPPTPEASPARSAAADPPARADETVEPAPGRGEFAIDLGPGPSLEALRGLWRTVKAQHGGALEGMRPLAALREQNGGSNTPELRLVIGPIADAATAARICALIGATGRLCQPAPFEGQRLALR